jgi:hypothetical protein
MKHRTQRRMLALSTSAALMMAAAPALAAGGKSLGKDSGVVPATLEAIPGSDIRRVVLTERAMKRIDLHTAKVSQEMLRGELRTVVPYSSIIYTPNGATWVYTNPKQLNFVRQAIEVDFIEGDFVALSSGPALGTTVATIGVAELYGTEFEVGH